MKNHPIFLFETLKLSFPIGKTILLAIIILPFLLITFEGIIRLIPIPETILVPSIDREINYAEIDIKLSRLARIEKEMKINCFLFGNSMVDFGINPSTINSQAILKDGLKPVCFNMALEASVPQTTLAVANIIMKRADPALVIIGISPINFTGEENMTRELINSPWFQYQAGIFSPEGWLVDKSLVYRYWLSFRKLRNPEYRSEILNMNMLIDSQGFQIREKDNLIFEVQKFLKFPNFSLAEKDLLSFKKFISINSTKTKVIVIEMPVHPDFLPYYVQGGENGYQEIFVEPIEKILNDYDIAFIRTQPEIQNIVTADGWIDYAHLNDKGAGQFSRWLANILSNKSQ